MGWDIYSLHYGLKLNKKTTQSLTQFLFDSNANGIMNTEIIEGLDDLTKVGKFMWDNDLVETFFENIFISQANTQRKSDCEKEIRFIKGSDFFIIGIEVWDTYSLNHKIHKNGHRDGVFDLAEMPKFKEINDGIDRDNVNNRILDLPFIWTNTDIKYPIMGLYWSVMRDD